jgi:branched-chain amino acid transport system ATP-binding protein
MLKISDLNVFYDGLQALRGIHVEVAEGQCATMIGSNGAGKTTLLKCISGLIRPRSGSILFLGEPIHGIPTHEIVKRGIIQVPEGRKLFPRLNVLGNLEMGAYLPEAKGHFEPSLMRVFELFPVLSQRRRQLAGTLSGGEQQMLALARALMARPRLMMLDEPSLGLAPKIAAEIFKIVGRLGHEGITILLVSQDVIQALRLAHRGYVLENSRIVMQGSGKDLLGDPEIKRAYLGI